MSSTVEELIKKKKEELSAKAAASTPVSTATAIEFDPSMVFVPKDTITYEDIAGEAHPDGIVRTYPKPPVFANTQDIPEPDLNWVADHATLADTLQAVLYGHNLLMVGAPGTGKTKDLREVCARVRMPYYRVNGMIGMSPDDLIGSVHIADGETMFVDGAVITPVEHGGLLALDEPFKMDAGALMSVQALAEENGDRYVLRYGHPDPSKLRVHAHPEFRMALCDNVRGTGDGMEKMAATQIQDQSFINRMSYKINKDYMKPEIERRAIGKAYPWILPPLANKMVKFAGLMRRAWENDDIELPFSFRELQTWSEAIAESNGNIKQSLGLVYGNLLVNEVELDIYNKAIADVGI